MRFPYSERYCAGGVDRKYKSANHLLIDLCIYVGEGPTTPPDVPKVNLQYIDSEPASVASTGRCKSAPCTSSVRKTKYFD